MQQVILWIWAPLFLGFAVLSGLFFTSMMVIGIVIDVVDYLRREAFPTAKKNWDWFKRRSLRVRAVLTVLFVWLSGAVVIVWAI